MSLNPDRFRLIEKTRENAALFKFVFSGDVPPTNIGQFYLVASDDPGLAYLRRVVFPTHITIGNPSTFQINVYGTQIADLGFAQLISRPVDSLTDFLGPFGRGFQIPSHAKDFLVLAENRYFDLMLDLANTLTAQNKNVTLALQCINKHHLPDFSGLMPSIELIVTTINGSFGHQGEIFSQLGDSAIWADHVMAAGSTDFYRQLDAHLHQKRPALTPDFTQVMVLDTPIHLCGVGACQQCTVATKHGLKLACIDGPVFNLSDLSLVP